MSPQAAGAMLGLAFACGALLAAARLGATRTPGLARRIAPFIPASAASVALRRPPASTMSTVVALLRPSPSAASVNSLRERLARAGRAGEVDQYRIEQVAFGLTGVLAGGALGLVAVARSGPAIAMLLLPLFGAGVALLLADRRLARQASRRRTRVSQQLPTVAELLAFAVAAGESPVVAIERVTRTVSGDLSGEFAGAIADLRAGAPLDSALRGVASRTASPEVERFVDGLVVAIERGTPLVDVLRAQAADARAAGRRSLIETAGRKDVLMLVPVVFLILPTVVLIALFPGFQSLQLVVP